MPLDPTYAAQRQSTVTMRLRTALALLTAVTAVPLVALFIIATHFIYDQQNQSIINAAIARNRATLQAVDAQLSGSISVLQGLARSASLARNDTRAFADESNQVIKAQHRLGAIALFTPSGLPLPGVPDENSLASEPAPDLAALRTAVESKKPAIGTLTRVASKGGEVAIPLHVPVIQSGKVVYVMTGLVNPTTFYPVLASQQMPKSWVSGLVSADGHMIARVPEVPPGASASRDYLRETDSKAEGWYRGSTLEGVDTYTAFSRSALTGWSVGFAMPASDVVGQARHAVALLLIGLLASAALAILMGAWISRRISRPISALAQAVQSIRDEPTSTGPYLISEIDSLANAFHKSSSEIRARDTELAHSRHQLELQSLALQSENTNRAHFLALISHELRNPLAPLRSGLALLTLKPDDGRRGEVIAMMERQIGQMTRLIDDLMDIGRIDSGQLELRFETLNLMTVVSHAIETTAPMMVDSGHQFTTELPEGTVWVRGDPTRLKQVLINLLNNACKYTPNSGRIGLSVSHDTNTAWVSVTDTGIGFDSQDNDRVFELFTRLPAARGRDGAGLGVGLSLARTIIELHGGHINAKSQGSGKGSVFTFSLPLVPRPSA